MVVAVPLFDRVTALDAVGPAEVLGRLPDAEVRFVAARPGPVRTDGALTLLAEHALAEVPEPDIVLVPGGPGTRERDHLELVEWIAAAHETSTWTTSVCTGALLLGAAGVLQGLRATTHWLYLDRLEALGAVPTAERVVEEGTVLTAAGVSAGIDMALLLAERVAGREAAEAVQLSIEYDPQPPFRAGSPQTAGEATVARVRGAAERADALGAGGEDDTPRR
jgi:transcriptional regulator GlxA family with amidase domain